MEERHKCAVHIYRDGTERQSRMSEFELSLFGATLARQALDGVLSFITSLFITDLRMCKILVGSDGLLLMDDVSTIDIIGYITRVISYDGQF